MTGQAEKDPTSKQEVHIHMPEERHKAPGQTIDAEYEDLTGEPT
jgi:hypothetical protein